MPDRASSAAASRLAVAAPEWNGRHLLGLAALVVTGIALRIQVWPAPGLVGDLDQFVLWVHGIAVDGWFRAYDQDLSFPPVMAWIWGLLATFEPLFRTATDSSDVGIRALMKMPASLADLGIAAGVGWWFRGRPAVSLVAVGAVMLWPATWYVSAWWGQYESLYVLPALLAVLGARAGRPDAVAVLVAVSLMTKPQALPFVVPFTAWFLATEGWRGLIRVSIVGGIVIVLGWLPFLAAGGAQRYLANLDTYQNSIFNVLSLRAWNPWWLVQELGAGGGFVADGGAILGPLTFRHLGFIVAGVLAVVVFVSVWRRPTAEVLALGVAAISLVAFVSLTTMHERYAFPAFVFLMLALARPGVVVTWITFAVTFLLNLVVAVPPAGWTIPLARPLGIVGAIAMTAITALTLLHLVRAAEAPDEPGMVGVPVG